MSEVLALLGVLVMGGALWLAGFITGASIWKRRYLERTRETMWALTRLGQHRAAATDWWDEQAAREREARS